MSELTLHSSQDLQVRGPQWRAQGGSGGLALPGAAQPHLKQVTYRSRCSQVFLRSNKGSGIQEGEDSPMSNSTFHSIDDGYTPRCKFYTSDSFLDSSN